MEDETEKKFSEGMIRKGGMNNTPTTPRPEIAPVPQETDKKTVDESKGK